MDEVLSKINKDSGDPQKLTIDGKFKFICDKGLTCFTECCSNLDIFLTPADVVSMKNRLGMTATEFIDNYTDVVMLKKIKIPLLKLKMKENGLCRYVSDQGCEIYEHRPLACRYYPIGFGIMKRMRAGGAQGDDFYFLIREEYCKGCDEEKEWTVREWRINQGIEELDDVNKAWVDLILDRKIKGATLDPDERSLNLFFMGSYDMDSFRKFVFESRFLDVIDLSDEEIELIKNDEFELLKLAHNWLKYVLFKEPTISLKET